ncbi:MAG: hypothetical protein IPN94_02555 [Sphingobacteriales bacterium]|nr:hypothetical protein [Sphingobacteriales bacterium]
MSKKKNTFTNANSTPISVTKPQTTTHNTNNKWWLYGSYVALFLLVFMLYKVGFGNDFVDWDDTTYIKENLYVLNPSWSNAWLFFKSSYFGNYHPLTMWSYCQLALFGKDASSIIITNVLLHALNSAGVVFSLSFGGQVVVGRRINSTFFCNTSVARRVGNVGVGA